MDKKSLDREVSSSDSIIASGTRIKGAIMECAGISISGYLDGEIKSQGLVKITREGEVKGTIKAPFVLLEGGLDGTIESSERVELRAGCKMYGNIHTAKIAIAEGSVFHGQVRMSKENKGYIEPHKIDKS
ncbi:MAG: polymer-forming cytoskeletal protein [Candidatus Aminicenantes bacterium]|nr:polymer-forming cytoskeletal protein [Candidatus Aminicenantes bacterium]MDH5743514.1 polymer-forming cytoskeletal protein [Candidatus Aminicenantes bacterium]